MCLILWQLSAPGSIKGVRGERNSEQGEGLGGSDGLVCVCVGGDRALQRGRLAE